MHWLVLTTVVLFLALTALAFFSWRSAEDNREAVCNLRGDLERRVLASEDFLTKHPDTIVKLGFTTQQVQKEIIGQRRTLNALSVVSC